MGIQAGTRLGNYEVVDRLGAGSMGEVYRARDLKLRRDVALKVLPDDVAQNEERLRRFEQEALTASSLSHPNIIHIYDIGEDDGRHFVAMELVEGRTLRQVLDSGPLPFELVLDYGCQIAEGLAKTHSVGVIHRDVKPENLIISDDGYIKIVDFGLAKQIQTSFDGSETETLTKLGTVPGVILGTVGYMSPEQAKGQPADARSDQFSFGAVLYELACGRRAFDAPSAIETLTAIVSKEPEPLSHGGPVFHRFVNRCLSKNPDARFETTAAVLEAIRFIRQERPSAQAPVQDSTRHTVGREDSLSELTSAFDAARAGRGSLRCIAGEAGIGKTTLVETFLRGLQGLDATIVCRGRCSERLAGAEAYLPFLEALEGLLRTRVSFVS
jgi:serine/threonine protein kinase